MVLYKQPGNLIVIYYKFWEQLTQEEAKGAFICKYLNMQSMLVTPLNENLRITIWSVSAFLAGMTSF